MYRTTAIVLNRMTRRTALTVGATALVLGISGVAMADVGHGDGYAFGKPGSGDEARRTVRIVAKDNSFTPKKVMVRGGETVRFRIVNKGEFAHDFTIGTPDIQEEHRKEMAEMTGKGMLGPEGMQPGAMHGDGDSNAVLVKPGETQDLVWTFAEAKELQFGCNIPGHYESGMFGQFVVR